MWALQALGLAAGKLGIDFVQSALHAARDFQPDVELIGVQGLGQKRIDASFQGAGGLFPFIHGRQQNEIGIPSPWVLTRL